MQPPDIEVLAAGARALGLQPTTGQLAALLDYLALLAKWNRAYNLTAVRDRSSMVAQHLLDCLAVVAPLRRQTSGKVARLLDVGSGAGLPGAVLAVVMPELDVTCVDAVGKKASFVRQVAGELALRNLHSVQARAENLDCESFNLITSRAFASLADFVALTWHLRGEESVWMAMKAKLPEQEIHDLADRVEVFHVEQLIVPGLGAERCLVWMRERH